MLSKASTILCAALILASSASAQLPAGNYTIDPALPGGGNNFQTWASAIAALASGITGTGHVVFTVASVTFNESVTIPSITGTSASSTVTFIALGPPAVINAGGLQDALVVQGLHSYLTFENIQLRGWTRYGLHIAGSISGGTNNRATFCTFRKIDIDGPTGTSSTITALRNEYAWDTVFEDCVFRGGGNVAYSQQIMRNVYRRCEIDGKGVATRLLAPFNSNDADNTWENCFFHDCGPTSNGLQVDLSSYGNMFWHNTVIVNTSGTGVLLGSLTSWSRANSFRNNVVVNLGSGTCITYGVSTSGTFAGMIECNDLDYNVYYAPNGMACRLQSGSGFTTGTLAAWNAFLAANPQLVIPGGATIYDPNSIEADPGLMSLNPPYDIHLATGSICRDAGTTTYVAGPWISFNPAATVVDDFEGDPRPAMNVDIGADEVACAMVEFETNSPASSVDVDGIQGSGCTPAVTVRAQGTPGVLNVASTNVGLGWEAALVVAPILPASGGAFVSPNGQIINIDFAAPVIGYLNGGTLPFFGNPFPGNFSANFVAPPGPLSATFQMVNLSFTHPDGFEVSQPAQLDVP